MIPEHMLPRDSGGRLHAVHGILNSEAAGWAFVCFDDHPDAGMRAWYFNTDKLRRFAKQLVDEGEPLKLGTGNGNTRRDTGGGYLFSPSAFCSRYEHISPAEILHAHRACGTGDFSIMGQYIAATHLGAFYDRDVTPIKDRLTQLRGDLAIDWPGLSRRCDLPLVEVKSRHPKQRWPNLFLQVTETNPDGRIR